ncbi:protein-glutamate O-methyltransferase CheR [Sphingomonas sp. ABOLD]|uniref:protein-glutamate O-methyltransferase n=1 Tax=Sphingomonas trueperi TaxID=53317 RepID=A0A7X6BCK2_9SPHN|nr:MULTISPECIES: protein-glutamate O-methyltransferase CheR [unclassified Sphingomonas]NJB97290.1 chemotaxis protein methyltransferase CheR [Sphingomonas trueperi]RSV34362.1 protein-glutamate O-methyltransferase CheR [Sphingomonas sp. ABOLE]RSV50605.1 protein-glutamate O-methyltransferase CheR [Sphingomonas sp. ABOLD]
MTRESTIASAPPAALSDDEVARVGALLYRWTGMIFGANKRYYIERRIGARMARSGMAEAARYLDFVGTNPAEREALINAFTINETYFYREEHQFAALARQILPELIRTRRPGDLIRIWSMPCSTGEEAYSIAIWLLENWPLVDAYHIEIVGSDLDTAALAQAQAGRYAARALARLPADVVERYFEPERGHRRKIIDDLRESVRFTPANIVDRATLTGLGRFDVILCRNLLIYFDDDSRQLAASNLFESLNSGGFVCLGHSESMARITDRFTMARLEDAIVYRKP